MNKPIKPEITIPQSFAENGVKTDFDDTLLADGFDNLRPDVLAGDNLNKFIDDTYKGLNYGMAAADALNLINEGETLIVRNGEFTSGAAGGGGLEIGDIGIAPLGIDETKGKRRYLNGQLIIQDQYVQFTNKVKSAVALYPSLACTESEWQTTATMTVGGQVGKFVIDDEAGTIRLPKIIMPIQGLTDLSKLGEIVEAGLPNITGTNGINGSLTPTGCFYSAIGNANTMSNTTINVRIGFDASLSNPTYGNSNTVQQEQIQYPYFIQVATGAETEDNIINEIELNNPFSLLDYKYSEYELNNISWLRSEGQYNSKAIYPAVYDLLLKIYNGTETKAGVSVKLSTEAFTDYDFVLNTAEETFRLPKLVKTRVLIAKKEPTTTDPTWYNLYSDGWCEQGGEYTKAQGAATALTVNLLKAYKDTTYNILALAKSNGATTPQSYDLQSNPTVKTVNSFSIGMGSSSVGWFGFNWETSGYVDIPTIFDYTENVNLYFYVGETVQNANLINAGRIEEKLVDKVDRANTQWATNACMPDYANGITISTAPSQTKPFIAPSAGVLFLVMSNQGTAYVQIFVNGVVAGYSDSNPNSDTKGLNMMLSKNDSVYIVASNSIMSTSLSKFYPLKGAN